MSKRTWYNLGGVPPVEMAAATLDEHGLVTQGEMAAAKNNVNGHSGLTAQRHYQLVNSLHDAQRRKMEQFKDLSTK